MDQAVWNYAEELRKRYAAELKKVTQLQKQWALRKPVLDAHCLALQKEIQKREQEIDELVMEKLKTVNVPPANQTAFEPKVLSPTIGV